MYIDNFKTLIIKVGRCSASSQEYNALQNGEKLKIFFMMDLDDSEVVLKIYKWAYMRRKL